MAAPRTVRRANGDLALEVGAIRIPGATAGQTLVFQSDGAGGVEGVAGAGGGGATGTTSDNMSGTGWATATPSGGALASWATSPARLVLDCDPGAAGTCGVSKASALSNREEYSIAIRVRVDNGDNSNQTRIILACGQSANDCAKMALFTNGSIEVGATVGGSYVYWNVATHAAIDATARTGGELWLRFDRRAGCILWSYGINDGASGEIPTVWTEVYSSTERHVAGADAAARNGKKAANGTFVGIYAATLSGVNLDAVVLAIESGPALSFGGV